MLSYSRTLLVLKFVIEDLPVKFSLRPTQCDQNFLMDPACQETYRMGYSVVHDHGFHLRGPLLVGCAQKYYTISFKDARKKLNYFNYS